MVRFGFVCCCVEGLQGGTLERCASQNVIEEGVIRRVG